MTLAALIKKVGLRGFATATPATSATGGQFTPPSVATVATVAVATASDKAANDAAPDPDRHCWPHTNAMTTAEIDRFLVRVNLFTSQAMGLDEAEALADSLVIRDREGDDRTACRECQHFRPRSRRCGNHVLAEMPLELGLELATMAQRRIKFRRRF